MSRAGAWESAMFSYRFESSQSGLGKIRSAERVVPLQPQRLRLRRGRRGAGGRLRREPKKDLTRI